MERYLNVDNLKLALGDLQALPSAEDLQRLIGEAEVAMFMRHAEIPEPLIKTAWYLHSIASSRSSLELYDFERRRRAHQVSSHIFDLVLQTGVEDRIARLSYIFAAQVGYIRGGLTPNATALYKSFNDNGNPAPGILSSDFALEIGVMLLALDRKSLFNLLPAVQIEIAKIIPDSDKSALTILKELVDGCWELLLYLSNGDEEALARAKVSLESIVRDNAEHNNINTRWVAAHLLDICEDFGVSSVWSILPPEVPSAAAKAMTLGSPPVLSLWPPQMLLLKSGDQNSPLLLATRRLMLSIPTSAGKTLLAQFFVLSHLAQGAKGVCFVAPTHSLCREIRKSLEDRLRLMKQEVAYDMPFGVLENLDITQGGPQVEVMTPERFSHLLRSKPKEMLEKFSLFVIDEAHLISDESRGWGLEASLSLLHMLTRETEHRIILMSSSLGNRTHIIQWIGVEGGSLTFHNEWRGPRRLYAIYTPEKSKDIKPEVITTVDKRGISKTQYHYALDGMIRLKVADTSGLYLAKIDKKVGDLYTKPDADGAYHPVAKQSTPFYKMLVPLIVEVAESGPVLVIVSTRRDAQNLARELAEQIGSESTSSQAIAELATIKLGTEHLLSKVLKNGVAFHHAALPADLQDAIETGVRSGVIKYLIATTTLVEGVNLPVRTVIIGNTGSYTSEGFREFIKGPKLVNAIGRAGRSAKESEGWIILADRFYNEDHFNQLMHTKDEDIHVTSNLSSEVALVALAAFEKSMSTEEDAVFSADYSNVSDFMSFVWVVASTLEELRETVTFPNIEDFLFSTLAWQQLSDVNKDRWLEAAKQAYVSYAATKPEDRKRWARSGTSLPTAKKLDSLLLALLKKSLIKALEQEYPFSTEEAFEILLPSEAMQAIFSLPEAPKIRFRRARNSRRDSVIDVDYKALMMDWVNGLELNELVEKYLSDITDKEYAYECLGDFIASVFEHYLPWILGVLIAWANEFPQNITGDKKLINPQLTAYVHYGVNNPASVDLMMGGVKSRRLAVEIGEHFKVSEETSLKNWLYEMGITGLREKFKASDSELKDLLGYLRPKDSFLLAEIISGQAVDLGFSIRSDSILAGEAVFKYFEEDESPARIGIYQNDRRIVTLPISVYADIESLIETGLPYAANFFTRENGYYAVRVQLINYSKSQNEAEFSLDDIEF